MNPGGAWWLRRRGAGRLLAWVIGAFFAAIVFLFIMIAALLSGSNGCGDGQGPVSGKDIPPRLIPLYQAGAQRYQLGALGPAVLAAINGIETDFGRNRGTSSAGANGWMQFIPSTWARYGVDANRDGRKDPHNPMDAIFAAANYLHASGAPQNWHAAIFAYNPAEWYVAKVLAAAQRYASSGTVSTTAGGTTAGATAALVPQSLQTLPDGSCAKDAALPPGSLTAAQLKRLNGVTDVGWSGGPLATWIAYLYRYARQHGWDGASGQISLSGFRTAYQQRISGSSIKSGSHHQTTRWPGGAIDIGNATSRARFNYIIARSPYRGLIHNSGAAYGDPVHSSSGIAHGGSSF